MTRAFTCSDFLHNAQTYRQSHNILMMLETFGINFYFTFCDFEYNDSSSNSVVQQQLMYAHKSRKIACYNNNGKIKQVLKVFLASVALQSTILEAEDNNHIFFHYSSIRCTFIFTLLPIKTQFRSSTNLYLHQFNIFKFDVLRKYPRSTSLHTGYFEQFISFCCFVFVCFLNETWDQTRFR